MEIYRFYLALLLAFPCCAATGINPVDPDAYTKLATHRVLWTAQGVTITVREKSENSQR
jgi:hypothetical protein